METLIIAGVALVAVALVALPLLRSRGTSPSVAPAPVIEPLSFPTGDPASVAEELVRRARAALRSCPEHGPCAEPGARFCSQCGRSVVDLPGESRR
jgi:hypothetical protein